MNEEEKNRIRDKIVKDYYNILEIIPVGSSKIDINVNPGFNIEGLIEDLNEEYHINCDYMIFEFNQIRIYIE